MYEYCLENQYLDIKRNLVKYSQFLSQCHVLTKLQCKGSESYNINLQNFCVDLFKNVFVLVACINS